MTPRINFGKYLASDAGQALLSLGKATDTSSIERTLLDLVKIRGSQINGCAFCLDMHTQDARAAGETEQRLYALSAWRETPFFSERERAVLEWTEAVTRIADTHVPDDVYDRVRAQFDEPQIVALTFAVVTINAFNRIALTFRAPVGTYKPQPVPA